MNASLRCLVTGGDGFIGRHLADRLVHSGCDLRTMVRAPKKPAIGEQVVCDIRDKNAVLKVVNGIDVVFHLAGVNQARGLNFQDIYETNVLGTLNIVSASIAAGCRIIFFSTGQVYASSAVSPVEEGAPTSSENFYTASKLAGEGILNAGVRTEDLNGIVLRIFNTFGPGQTANTLIRSAIAQFASSEEITLGDLSPRRDFVFVSDVVDAAMRTAFSDIPAGTVLNIGSGHETEVKDVARIVGTIMHPGIEIRINSTSNLRRATGLEPGNFCADISRAEKMIGWKPEISLRAGLESTIDSWCEENRP